MKSLSNFVNYGKRNRESLAELFITLLIKVLLVSWQLLTSIRRNACLFILKTTILLLHFMSEGKQLPVFLTLQLSSVEKLWPKGLCASTCNGSWSSKTWDSKVACISVITLTFLDFKILCS